ncbi:MAG: HAMP domain-containing histidine kinase [Deltaproteobacteria bacterium]|nr:HAMP domain-containing histidine kinase [Deltaproteobacteria bacterium]
MKLTILKRLIFGHAAIMLLIVFLGGYVSLQLNKLDRIVREISAVDSITIDLTERLSDKLFSQVVFEKKYLISQDQDFYEKFWDIMKQLIQDLQRLESLMITKGDNQVFSEVKQFYDNYISLFSEEVDAAKSNPNYPHLKYQERKEKLVDKINDRLRRIMKIARSNRDAKIRESSRMSYHAMEITYITVGLAIIISILISFYNTRSINHPILLLQKQTKEIAKGRFEKIRDVSSPLEIKELADDFNLMCERLKELDEMKKDFISHVSHNLRTPLTAMKEATGMLIEGTYADMPEKQKELLAITQEECERLIDSVTRILDLSRMEAKMMDYHLEKSDLLPLIQKCLLKLAPLALRKKIDLELKPPPDLPFAKIDAERIGQLMENLIGNALKFSSAGGKVVLSISVRNGGKKFIEVAVADTGCGIPKENLERIFNKFERIDRGKETERGTGLGLSISKHIIADHGGKIWAESKLGKGSTFFFTLPV